MIDDFDKFVNEMLGGQWCKREGGRVRQSRSCYKMRGTHGD